MWTNTRFLRSHSKFGGKFHDGVGDEHCENRTTFARSGWSSLNLGTLRRAIPQLDLELIALFRAQLRDEIRVRCAIGHSHRGRALPRWVEIRWPEGLPRGGLLGHLGDGGTGHDNQVVVGALRHEQNASDLRLRAKGRYSAGTEHSNLAGDVGRSECHHQHHCWLSMKAIILVGGEGTRLRPLTYVDPKQMLPILGVPMLERVLTNLALHGVTDVVLSLGYLPGRFLEKYPDNRIVGLKVSYAVEPERLDTAGAIRFAALHAGVDETFIVINGDVLTDLNITKLMELHRARGAEATIALHPVEDPSRFGVVSTDDDGRVRAFIEKPSRESAPTNNINAGTYIMEPSVLDAIEPNARVSVERVTFPLLVERGTLYAMPDDSYWLDTGTPESYLQANFDALSGRRAMTTHPEISGKNWIADSVTLGEKVRVLSSAIESGATIGAGTVIDHCVIMAGAVIEEGCTIRHSVVGPKAVIGANSSLLATCVVAHGHHVPANSHLEGDVRVGGPA